MAKQILFQSDFTGGEISPRLYGQVAVEKVKSSLKTATNVYLQPQGPVVRRTGTQFIKEVKTSSQATRLVTFRVSASVAYVLEFGELYIRFYRDKANILSGGSPYEVVTPYYTGQIADLQFTKIGNTLYIVHPTIATRQLVYTSDAVWTLSNVTFDPPACRELGVMPSATITPAASSGAGVNFTIGGGSLPFQAGDVGRQIRNLVGTGRATIVSITSATVAVCDITQNFPGTSAIASQSWIIDGSPIAELNITAGPVGKLDERIVITAEDTGSAAAQATFRLADVGKYLRFAGGLVEIITYTSSSIVVGVVKAALDSTAKTTAWTMEESLWTSVRGFPSVVSQYQQRLVLASTTFDPQTVWLSAPGVYDYFAGGSNAADSLEFTPASEEVNTIQWLKGSKDLIVGTTATEFTISGAEGAGTALTPDSGKADAASSYGSAENQTVAVIGSNIIFEQADGKSLRAYGFDLNKDRYVGGELTFWAEHIAKEGIKEFAYAQYPDSLLYVVLDSGDMLVGTYLPDAKDPILGWTRYRTDGLYENVVTLPLSGGTEVWAIVKRTIGGSTKRYIEVFDDGSGEANIDGFVDSFLTLSNPKTITAITKANPAVVTSASHGLSNGDVVRIRNVSGMTELNGRTFTIANVAANTFELSGENSSSYTTYVSGGSAYKQVTTITGLTHLEGKTVAIRADGAVHPEKTVASGSITLNYAASEVVAGLAYTSTVETLPATFETNIGQMNGQKVRWANPNLRLYKSGLPLLESNFVPARGASDRMDYRLGLYTGDVSYGPLGWGDGSVTITYSDPLPLAIQAIYGTIDSGAL